MLQELFELEWRLPAGLRPTFRGARFVFGMALGWAGKLFMLSILATLMLLAGPGRGMVLFLGLLAVAAAAGAVAGAVHGSLRRMSRWGQLGIWLRWTLSIFACIIAVALLTPKGPLSLDPTFFIVAAGCSALAACGLTLLDDRKPTRPSPRRFRMRQSRERLWAAADRVRARLQKGAAPCPSRSIS